MITLYWTTTTTTERTINITIDQLLDAIAKSGQEAPARETDEEYVVRVMDDVDIESILPFLEDRDECEILSEDIERSFDDWAE